MVEAIGTHDLRAGGVGVWIFLAGCPDLSMYYIPVLHASTLSLCGRRIGENKRPSENPFVQNNKLQGESYNYTNSVL